MYIFICYDNLYNLNLLIKFKETIKLNANDNNFLLNSYSTSKNIKELNTIAFVERNKRSSRFRGVSKNGNQWQVLMMINKNKSYIGSYDSEEFAARIYDVLAIKNRGMNARTNFKYNSKQIKNICEKDIDIKSKNINEIISQLIV